MPRRFGLALALTLACYCLSLAPAHAAPTLEVTSEAQLRAALTAVTPDGGTIRIMRGFDVGGPLLLQGASHVTIEGVGAQPTLHFPADAPGLECLGTDDLIVRNLRFWGSRQDLSGRGNGHAVHVMASNRVLLFNLAIENWSGHGITMAGWETQRLNLPQGVWDSNVIRCTIKDVNIGIMLFNDPRRILVQDCSVTGAMGAGIYADDSHRTDGTETPRSPQNCVIDRNIVTDAWVSGISLAGARDCVVSNNQIGYAGLTAQAKSFGITVLTGLYQLECVGNTIEGNTIEYNRHIALFLNAARSTIIRNNTFRESGYNCVIKAGVPQIQIASYLSVTSSDNVLENNHFTADDPRARVSVHIAIMDSACANNRIWNNTFGTDRSGVMVQDLGTLTVVGEDPPPGDGDGGDGGEDPPPAP